ncbi:MAG TPA: helix-turn-helix domain-containing protein, partial [Clostridiales bacterium]|nr:helix-turn-helix domain-containing protein [Clostridiales bacterium]
KIHAITLIDPSLPPIVLANEAIKDVLTVNRPISVIISNIIEQVGKTFGVSVEDIRSNKKKATISNARQFSMYIIREITNLSLEAIGKEFGGKNHSTVLYSIEAVEKKMEQNPALKATLFEITKNIQEN